MQEELNHFEINNIWELVPKPSLDIMIGGKYFFVAKILMKMEIF